MRRLLAFLAAGLLIVVAIFVRSRLDARDADQATSGQVTGTLVCVPEARAACEALRTAHPTMTVKVEEAGTTLEALWASGFSPGQAGFDAWLAPAPYPAMVDEARARASSGSALGTPSRILGRTPVTLTIWSDRYQALQSACPNGEVTWVCIGDVAGTSWAEHGGQETWGPVKPGHPPADTSATGLLVLAQASGQQLGRTDYASNDLTGNAAFDAWFDQLETAVPTWNPPAGSPLQQMLTTGRASFDLAGAFEAQAGPSVTTSRDKDRLSILYPSPLATADLVVTPVTGSAAGSRLQELLESEEGARALAAAGWRVGGQPEVAGIRSDVALPDTSGLPRPGVLEALRKKWIEVIR